MATPETYTYTYSGDQVTQIERVTDLGQVIFRYKAVYEYAGSRISRINHHYPNVLHKAVFSYNADNSIDDIKWYIDTALFRTDKFFYTNGRLAKVSSRKPDWPASPVHPQFDLVFTYTGNNITGSRYTLVEDPSYYRNYVFTYSSQPNAFKDRHFFDYMVVQGGEEFIPLSISQNQVASMTSDHSLSSDVMNRVYTYTYRPDGLIEKVSYPTTNGPYSVNLETKYEYDCN